MQFPKHSYIVYIVNTFIHCAPTTHETLIQYVGSMLGGGGGGINISNVSRPTVYLAIIPFSEGTNFKVVPRTRRVE